MPRPRTFRICRAHGVVFLFLFLLPVFAAKGAYPDAGGPAAGKAPEALSLAEVDNTLKAFERMEASGEQFFPSPFGDPETPFKATEDLQKADGSLRAHMEAHPDDPNAMLLKARLLRAQDISSPPSFSSEPGGTPKITGGRHTAEIHRLLDAVLQKDPGNAEAHYWKSRVVNTRELTFVDNAIGFAPWDKEKSLYHASRAHELAPGNLVYREYYAQNLLAAGKTDEVIRLMKDVEGGNHPMYRLLADWRRIPLPDNVLYDERMTNTFIEMASMADDRPEYPQLRFAVFVLFGPAATVENFYRGKFGGFKLTSKEKASSESMETLAAFLEWKGDVLVPTEGVLDSNDEKSGVLLMVMEHSKPPPEVRMMYDAPEDTPITQLIISNMRRFEKIK